ncbi:MAG TPA: methyltransferase domain-containing protein [Stellaceae bacterium]|jgi:predicted SAM-dependent methyltransferase|nr:methyltransferase domain-containing protein [Stellaceae bacterium]
MSDIALPQSQRLLVNLGSGPKGSSWLPAALAGWRELRVDVDPASEPDLLADMTNLSAIADNSVDAVWSSHCLEHLHLHEVTKAIAEAFRILSEGGFLCLIVPDLQAIAQYIVNDRLHEVVYESPAGPVRAHDMIYGYGPYLAKGMSKMAHHSGFTPTLLLQKLQEAPFAEIVLRRRPNQELAAIACKRAPATDRERETFLASLEL